MKKLLLLFLLFTAGFASGQVVTAPGQELPNTFQKQNTFQLGTVQGPVTFANLGTIPITNGAVVVITDGTPGNPCTGGGTGALGVYSNGAWNCGGSGGGGSGNVNTNPAGAQNIVQPIVGGAPTAFTANYFNGAAYVVASYNWVQSPAANLSTPGAQTVTLTPCPAGIDTSNSAGAPYGVYVSTVGTAEAVAVTGGTCTSGLGTGTITFTTVNAHGAGYTVGSASGGNQEAINVATLNGGANAVIVDSPAAGTNTPNYNVYWPVFLKAGRITLRGEGSMWQCFTRSVCLMANTEVGTGGPSVTVTGLTLQSAINVDGALIASVSAASGVYTINTSSNHNLVPGDFVVLYYSTPAQTQEGRFYVQSTPTSTQFTYCVPTPINPSVCTGSGSTFGLSSGYGWAGLENTALEDNGQGTTYRDIKLFGGSGRFNQGLVVGNDQALTMDGYALENSGILQATANFTGNAIYVRGDNGAAAVPWLHHLNISLQCSGNGIRDASGNSIKIADSVIQGFNQYAFYYKGGLQAGESDNVYQESAFCVNGSYPTGTNGGNPQLAQAGYILNGPPFTITGEAPGGGAFPQFAAGGACASVQRNYYVVAHDTNLGTSRMFAFGSACPATSGTNIVVAWPNPDLVGAGTRTFDILATIGTSVTTAPSGTGNFAITGMVGISGTCSTAGICTATDTQPGFSSYTVNNSAFWNPSLNFWPSGVVLGNGSRLFIDQVGQASSIVATSLLPTIFAKRCSDQGQAYNYSPFWAICYTGDSVGNGNINIGADVVQIGPASGNGAVGVTGAINLNLGPVAGVTARQLITTMDGSPATTFAMPGYVRAGTSADSFIGTDTTGNAGTQDQTYGAPGGHFFYVNDAGTSGTTWLEGLTAAAKTFKVKANGTIFNASTGFQFGGAAPNNHCLIGNGTNYVDSSSCGGLSGMTAGQVPIAATASTVTSSKALQGTDTNILTAGTISGTGASLCTDANGGATTSGCPTGGGISSATTNGIVYATSATAGTSITPPTVNGNYLCGYLVTAGLAVPPACSLPGVPVVAETTSSDTLLYSYRANFLNISGGSAFALTLPAAATNLASNLPFAIYNGNSGNATITPTTPNNINAGTSQAALTLLPGWADFVYQDSGGTINWHDLGAGFPTFVAFPTCSDTGGNHLNFTSTGITCGTSSSGGGVSSFSGDGTLITNSGSTGAITATLGTAGAHKWWGNNTGSTTTPGYLSIGTADLPTAIPIGNVGTSGLSGTAPVTINAAGAIGCAGCTFRESGTIRSTGLTAAVSTATLCAAGTCNVSGIYAVDIALYQSGTACTANTTGGVAPTLTWTDANGTTHSAQAVPLDTNASATAVTGTMLWNASTLGAWGSGHMVIDTNGTIIQYAIGFTQCGTGTATYAASLVVSRLD